MDDPRNIFVNQRQSYQQPIDQPQQPSGQQPSGQPPKSSGQQSTGTSYQQTQQPHTQTGTSPKTDPQTEYNKRVAEMKQLAEKYQREGEGQLVKDIVNTVIEQKARGQLTNDQLVAFAKRITPMLNADQRDRLNQLVEQLLKL